ncbi:MAG: alpha/beta hydrolase [Thermotogae bacterium]|nr:alpha/beta hydrolase [Thermotogota bacterium]HOO75656.1 alpha/beta hydrolase [Tepiditoga sp.]
MFDKKTGLYYEIHGEGYPLIFLNGIMMSTGSWNDHVKELEKTNMVITYDMRDQGKSPRLDPGYNISVHADDLKDLMDSLGIKKANFLGVSYGGQVSQIFISKYPDMVNKLILANTTYQVDRYLAALGQQWKQAAALYDGEKFFDIALPPIYSRPFYNENYDWLMNRRAMFKSSLTKSWYDGFIRLASSNDTFNVSDKLDSIKSTTLLIAGELDIITPLEDMEFMHSKIKNSVLKTIKGSGHGMFLEKMDEFLNIIKDFLNSK